MLDMQTHFRELLPNSAQAFEIVYEQGLSR